jgi:hypothetical protein
MPLLLPTDRYMRMQPLVACVDASRFKSQFVLPQNTDSCASLRKPPLLRSPLAFIAVFIDCTWVFVGKRGMRKAVLLVKARCSLIPSSKIVEPLRYA